MNNVESAEAAGDGYPVRTCQIVDGIGTLVGACFGSAFPTTVYIGHPGYKRMGGRAGYALGVGIVLFLAASFGALAVLHHLVPMAAVAPILVFIGLVITAQAFQASPRPHAMAVALAMLPHLSSLLMVKWGALSTATGQLLGVEMPALASQELKLAMLSQGAHLGGHAALAGGSILVGLLWGATAAFVIDRAWVRAALVLTAAAVLSLFGVVHAPELGVYPVPLVWTYLCLAAAMILIHFFRRHFQPHPGAEA
jgi:AGZA family xanthine/uracil permease-like MFS transporter